LSIIYSWPDNSTEPSTCKAFFSKPENSNRIGITFSWH
jgi:hypothetical protein